MSFSFYLGAKGSYFYHGNDGTQLKGNMATNN